MRVKAEKGKCLTVGHLREMLSDERIKDSWEIIFKESNVRFLMVGEARTDPIGTDGEQCIRLVKMGIKG